MRLVPPGVIARLTLPAVLTGLITPFLAGVTVVPAASTTASFTTVAAVILLRAATKVPFSDGPKLLAVDGVVAVDVVEDAKRAAALGGLRVVTAALHLGLGREHSWALVLHILGLLVFRVGVRELKEG